MRDPRVTAPAARAMGCQRVTHRPVPAERSEVAAAGHLSAGTLAMANSRCQQHGASSSLVYRDSQLPPDYTVFGTIRPTGGHLDKIAQDGVGRWREGGGGGGRKARDRCRGSRRCCSTSGPRNTGDALGRYRWLGGWWRMGQVTDA